jgi:DNA-binding response OmpR family regulator
LCIPRRHHMGESCPGAGVECDVAPGGGENPSLSPLEGMEVPSATILLVEDHLATRTFLADNLAADGYEVLEAESAAEAHQLIETAFPDVAIVDLGLPDRDGLDLVRDVRASDRIAGRADPDLPILILSGRTGELARLRGFERGADDYVVKPFSYPELHARLVALLRRNVRRPRTGRRRIGPLEIDVLARQAWLNGAPVKLPKKEFALLQVLASDPTRVLTKVNFELPKAEGSQESKYSGSGRDW